MARRERFCLLAQLNIGLCLLIVVMDSQTGLFGRGRFDAPNAHFAFWAVMYFAPCALIVLALGMLARRRWAWTIEGVAFWVAAVGYLVFAICGIQRFGIFGLGQGLGMSWFFGSVGTWLIRHGKCVAEERRAELAGPGLFDVLAKSFVQ